MNLIKRIEKAKAEGKRVVTVRYDVVKRMILNGEYAYMVCLYHYGDLAPERARYVAENEMTRGVRCYVIVDAPEIIVIRTHSGLYELYHLKQTTTQINRKENETC